MTGGQGGASTLMTLDGSSESRNAKDSLQRNRDSDPTVVRKNLSHSLQTRDTPDKVPSQQSGAL